MRPLPSTSRKVRSWPGVGVSTREYVAWNGAHHCDGSVKGSVTSDHCTFGMVAVAWDEIVTRALVWKGIGHWMLKAIWLASSVPALLKNDCTSGRSLGL